MHALPGALQLLTASRILYMIVFHYFSICRVQTLLSMTLLSPTRTWSTINNTLRRRVLYEHETNHVGPFQTFGYFGRTQGWTKPRIAKGIGRTTLVQGSGLLLLVGVQRVPTAAADRQIPHSDAIQTDRRMRLSHLFHKRMMARLHGAVWYWYCTPRVWASS